MKKRFALLLLLALASCISSASKSITPANSETVIARATTYEWMFPGYSFEAVPPNVSLPRVIQSDCGNLNLQQCQTLYDCVRSNGKVGNCNQFSPPGKPGMVPHKFGVAGVRPPKVNPFWLQTTWFVDQGNTVSGACASDSNNCSQNTCGSAGSNQGPCLTDGEVFARWATVAPVYGVNVTITEMSTAVNVDSPIVWNPVILTQPPDSSVISYTALWTGATTVAASTTITALTAKVPSTNTRLNVTLGTPPVTEQMIVNTSRSNSIAWVGQGTAVARVSQPVGPYTIPSNGVAVSPNSMNDAWLNGDSINLVNLPGIAWSQVLPTIGGITGSGTVVLQHMVLIEQPSKGLFGVGFGDDPVVIGNGVNLVECATERGIWVSNSIEQYVNGNGFFNTAIYGGAYGGAITQFPAPAFGSQAAAPFVIASGVLSSRNTSGTGTVQMQNVYMLNGVFVLNGQAAPTFSGYNLFGEVHLETSNATRATTVLPGGVIDASGGVATNGSNIQTGLIYGSGGFLDNRGSIFYSITNTASTTFPVSNIELFGGTTACCATVANPSVLNCNITLSATALGAGACSSATPALGNLAFAPGGGVYRGF